MNGMGPGLTAGSLPELPIGKAWPEYMLADGEVAKRLRETYARIAHSVAADQALAHEKAEALAWCREHGHPHRRGAGVQSQRIEGIN